MKIICCPTYRRKTPAILNLLAKYPSDKIYFFVRQEEFDSGFYDDWNIYPNAEIIPLKNLTNIGNTRMAIIDYCKSSNIKYCTMLDDSVSDMVSLTGKTTLYEMIDDIIENEILSDSFADKIAAVKIPVRKPKTTKTGEKTYSSSLYRSVLIDVQKISEKSINYVDSKLCGHEDFVFAYELHINGLFSIVSDRCKSKGRPCLPGRTENGGTHQNSDVKTIESETNLKSEKSEEYLKNKYGLLKKFKPISKFVLAKDNFTIICVHAFFKKEEILNNE